MFDEYQVGCFYLDKEKELFKGRYLYKGSGRMGECGSVYVPRNSENLERLYAQSPPPSGLSSQSVSFTGKIYFLLPRRQTGDGTLNLTLELCPSL